LPSLVDMMMSINPSAFLSLGTEMIWSGLNMLYLWRSRVFMQQLCSSSFGYRSDTCLAPFSAVRTVLLEMSSFGNNFWLDLYT
jgi:hypothetical protein